MTDRERLLRADFEKLSRAIALVVHSTERVQPYDAERTYDPMELEPYDALSGRFERAVEVALGKFFRSVELFESGIPSDTVRDRLNGMRKLDLIADVELWLEMRGVRNRIAHDYLPEEIKVIYDDITQKYAVELRRLRSAAGEYVQRRSSHDAIAE